MVIANSNTCDTEIELMISFYYENGYQFSLENDDFPTYWITGSETILNIRHDSFNNLGDGNYSLETRFIPIGQGEECCIMTDSVWVDTEPAPEPPCVGTASFYSIDSSIDYNNTNNSSLANLTVFWDADWSCNEIQYVQIDIFFKYKNNETVFYYTTLGFNLNGQSPTIANYTAYDLIVGDDYQICLTAWVERDEWELDAEIIEEVSIS
jgi:hypothetical protein